MTADARWRLVLVGYVLVQMVLRVLIGPALELDEAEAFTFGQELGLGFGPQPPLYYWMQWLAFQALGETLWAVAAVRAAILGGTLLLLFGLLRREVPVGTAGAATLSLGFLFQVVYESQRSLAHSSLVLLASVAMGATMVQALRTGAWRDHLLLGLAFGVGLLSKLNVAVWAGGLILAALLLPEWRRRLRPGRLLAAAAVALLLNGPIFAWMLANPDLALRSVDKFEVSSGLGAVGSGLVALALAVLSFNSLGAIALGLAWALGRAPGARPGAPPAIALLAAAAGLSLALVGLGVLASGATEVRDRWLMPLSWPLVPAGVVWLWPALAEGARRGLTTAAAAFWLIAAAMMPYASLVDPGYRGSDWTGMEAALRAAGAGELPVLVAHTWPAGNLLLRGEVPEPRFLARVEDLPDEALILVTQAGSEALRVPEVVARTERSRVVDVVRGDEVRSFAVVRLAPG